MTQGDESQLIDAVLNGNREAFQDLVRPYLQMWVKMATAYLANASDVEDAVQNGLVICYQHLGSFQARSRFSTWATKIIIRECHRLQQQEYRRRIRELPLDTVQTPAEAVEGLVLLSHLLHQALTESDRQLLEAAVVEGASLQELSARLSASPGSLKTRLWRIRKRLKQILLAAEGDINGPGF